MTKIREMINTSNMTIAVHLKDGIDVYVPPRGKLEQVSVENVDSVRKFFKVTEDLGEVKGADKKKVDLSETK